ncbi:probable serine/threonine-protein kinase DDB_G0267686 [Cotesia glomerata]|nr:probable serine/threonine-protein kinase DDB_G0267686 [Cotesia glomerata]
MFGTKLRTWMEAHIVRPKKKKDRKKGEKGFDSNCNSPGSHSNRSPSGLHQVYPLNSPIRNVDNIIINNGSTTTYEGATTNSSATSGGTGSVNLSSPESAYSTGYSTDGTSPGASYPPEYYINIRTGTHYFQSNKGARINKRPGETTSVMVNGPVNEVQRECVENVRLNGNINMTRENKLIRELKTTIPFQTTESVNHLVNKQSQLNSQAHQRDSLLQQQHQQQYQQQYHYHHQQQPQPPPQPRRTESYSTDVTARNSLPVPSSIPPPLISSPSAQSPRQRSRIRTNPWLSANSSGSSTATTTTTATTKTIANEYNKSRLTHDETSSSSGLKLTESSGSASDVNVNNHRNGNTKRECRQESLSAGRSPVNQNWRISPAMDVRAKITGLLRRASSSSSESSSMTQSFRSSEDDITLNEMMGKFDESYVYEKETDILSDSDPTDCEDYVNHSPSDIDTGQDGGDENDPLENDELDYIDNGSFLDLDNLEAHLPNTGHCTYFTFTTELTRRSTRLRESLLKRRSKDEFQHRTSSMRNNSKRQSLRHKKFDDKSGEKRKKRQSQRKKSGLEKCDDATANLNRVLVERMLLKNSGFNQGSRSVGGTPICLRRRKHHDINENLSSLKQNEDHHRNFIHPSVMDNDVVKRRSNSVSYINGNTLKQRTSGNSRMSTFASELALIEADREADRKYQELIVEAENILVNMKNTTTTTTTATATTNTRNTSPVIPSPSRRLHNGLANKRVELIKNTELNIELALLKSRNSQPELQSGSIRDIEHTSPKRQFNQPFSPIHRFIERNSGNLIKDNYHYRQDIKSSESPVVLRRTPQPSPCRSLVQNRVLMMEQETKDRSRSRGIEMNGIRSFSQDGRLSKTFTREQALSLAQKTSSLMIKKEIPRKTKENTPTSSSSESDDRCELSRAPLMTFRSIDMGPVKESTYYCPQSEPVKRKVYAGSATYGRIQKTLGEHIVLRNSDGDTATDDTDDSRRTLREKIAQLRQERLAAEANLNAQDNQNFQHHLTQLRRQMLMHTIEGLKRSLEDQSATLKQTCLQEPILDDTLP